MTATSHWPLSWGWSSCATLHITLLLNGCVDSHQDGYQCYSGSMLVIQWVKKQEHMTLNVASHGLKEARLPKIVLLTYHVPYARPVKAVAEVYLGSR